MNWRHSATRQGQRLTGIALVLLFVSAAMANDTYLSPQSVSGVTTIDAEQAKVLFDQGAVFIDVRTDAEWEAGRIPNAIHLELHQAFTPTSLGAVAKPDDKIVIYCNGPKCPRSSIAAAHAQTWGFTQVYYFRLGLPAWQAAGYAIE
jgi:rhodanese-related sulfurtransferase